MGGASLRGHVPSTLLSEAGNSSLAVPLLVCVSAFIAVVASCFSSGIALVQSCVMPKTRRSTRSSTVANSRASEALAGRNRATRTLSQYSPPLSLSAAGSSANSSASLSTVNSSVSPSVSVASLTLEQLLEAIRGACPPPSSSVLINQPIPAAGIQSVSMSGCVCVLVCVCVHVRGCVWMCMWVCMRVCGCVRVGVFWCVYVHGDIYAGFRC